MFFAVILVSFLLLFWVDFGLILGGFWEPRAVILGIDFLMMFRYRPKSGPRAPKKRFGVVFGWSGGGPRAAREGPRGVLGWSLGGLGVVFGRKGVPETASQQILDINFLSRRRFLCFVG